MKVAMLINDITDVGGVERVITNNANKFSEYLKYRVDIISVFEKKNQNISFNVNKEINIHYLIDNKESNLCKYMDIYKCLKKIILENEYDIILGCSVLINCILYYIKLFNIKALSNTRLIAWEHSQYENCSKKFKCLRKVVYPKLDGVVTLSKYDKNIFLEFCNNVENIPNIISFEDNLISNLENKKAIAVGRLEEEKGFDNLIEIFSSVVEEFPEWKLDIYGEGSKRNELEKLILDKKKEKSIFLKGFNSEIHSLYKDYSLFLLTSKTESFGMVLIEAMSCGLPCISFNCRVGPREIIKNMENGILVKENDNNEFAEKIMLVLKNSELKLQLSKNAIIKSREYHKKNILDKWNNYFNKLL